MTEIVFWDTAAFVALNSKDDNLYHAAVKVSQALVQAQTHTLTTDVVLTEVANTFSKVAMRPVAQRLIESMQELAALKMATIVHIDSDLWQRGWQLFTTRSDKEWGLTDCISFVVMQNYQIDRAFTSDRHFEQAGFIRLLK